MTKISNQYSLTNILTADLANSRLGINNVSPTVALDVTGAGKFSSSVTAAGNAATTSSLYVNNPSGNSGTAQYYADFTAGATVIGRILRGNGASGYEANGLNIDNFSGMQIKLNALGGSGGSFAVTGGAATFSSSITATNSGALVGTFNRTTSSGATLAIQVVGSTVGTLGSDTGGNGTFDISSVSNGVASNNVQISRSGGTPTAFFSSAGNVGIGTSSPSSLASTTNLIVRGTSAGSTALIQSLSLDGGCSIGLYSGASASDDGAILYQKNLRFGSVTDVGLGGFAERMRITSTGNVGIGTSSPQTILHINSPASTNATIYFGVNGTMNGYLGQAASVASLSSGAAIGDVVLRSQTNLLFTSGGDTERMRINSAGNVLIGTTNVEGKLTVDGGRSIFIANSEPYSIGVRYNTAAARGYFIGSPSSGIMVFSNADGTERFRITDGGNVTIAGSLSKGSGSFRIDHPLKPDTHQLVHSFIEGPQADLIYRGKLTLVNGKAQANIDEVSTMTEGTFEALCREVQCFTTNENGWDLVKGKVIGNIIYIESQNPNSTDEISWMVIGERKDKHMMDTEWTDEQGKVIVEPLKA